MEKLFYDLSEQEFSKGRKVLLWGFSFFFFLAGMGIVIMNLVLQKESIHISYSIAPFGICLFVFIIALMASFKRKDHFFLIDDDKIEYRYGLLKPVKYLHEWANIKEIYLPHKERKFLLVNNDESFSIVNLTWLERKKTSIIRKHIYYGAKEKNINVIRVPTLPSRK